jgi:signal transduction histidine kinase
VSDDGPGIPEAELETIRAGQETDLQHTSGLGLWVVTWGATLLGAEVDFDAGPEGTTVTVALPDRSDGSPPESTRRQRTERVTGTTLSDQERT